MYMAPTLKLHLKKIEANGAQLVAIARDEKNERWTVMVNGFRPYFMVLDTEDNVKLCKKRGLETVPGRPTIFGEKTLKVFVDTPASVPKRRKGFERTFEADVPYPRRFLVDLGIHDGFEVFGDYKVLGRNLIVGPHNLRPISFRTKDRQFLFDIETNKPEGSKHYSPPTVADGAVTALSFHDSFDEGQYYTYYWHPHHGTRGRPKTETRSQWSDAYQRHVSWTIVTFGSEDEMHVAILQYLKKHRPDVLQAWNGHHGHHRRNMGGFDVPYMINRLKRLKISAGQLSPLGQVFAGRQMFGKEAQQGGKGKWVCTVDGVQLIDGMTVYQIKEGGFTAQVPFSDLKRVTEKFTERARPGRGKKMKKDPSAIEEWWLNNTEQFLEYSFNDVDALVDLETSEGYLDFARDMQQFVGCEDANRLFTPMSLINTMLLRIALEENVCVPTSSKNETEVTLEDDEGTTGGFVLDPQQTGLQEAIGVLDLTTMYVHIIISGNISPETHVPNPTDEEVENLICMPSDLGPQFFLKPEVKVGMLPKLALRFKAKREYYDDLIAKATSIEEVKKLKHARQPAKQLLLGVWGTSLSEHFCLEKRECGSSITGTGRFVILNTRDHVKKNNGFVTYVDTDSNLCRLPWNKPKDEGAVEYGENLSKSINGFYDRLTRTAMNMEKHGFEIGLETIYHPFVQGRQKKQYAGLVVWSEGEWQIDDDGKPLPDKKGNPRDIFTQTGVSGMKTDAAPVTREATETVLRAVLSKVPGKTIIEYVRSMYEAVLEGDIPLGQVMKAVGMNQDLDDPDPEVQKNYIVRGARHGRETYDFEYPIGGRVFVVPLKGGEQEWLAVPDDEELPPEANIDMDEIADATILRPLQNILDWVDLEIGTIKHGTVATMQRRF